MRRATATALIIALSATMLDGCGSSSDQAQRMTLAALGTPSPSPPRTSASSVTPRCTNVTASLRPPAVMPAPGAMAAGSFMAAIKKRGYLTAGVDQNTFLFAYFNPLDAHVEGFEIDILRQIASAIFGNNNPNDIHFAAVTTAERIPAVQQGSVDIVADAVTITCQRRQQVDFSTVYYGAQQKLLVPSNSSIGSDKDLAGKRVCATIGSTSIQTLRSVAPRAIPVGVQQRTDCLVRLQQGSVDAITSDDSILLGFKAQDPYTKIVGGSMASEPYGIAISKAHPDFVRFVNGVLAQMRADGAWQAIYAHWLGNVASPIPAPPQVQYVG